MHKLTKITPLVRGEIYKDYTESKYKIKTLSSKYRVHRNTISKILVRGKIWDFTIHNSTTYKNKQLEFWLKRLSRTEKKLEKRILRNEIAKTRYEKDMAWELVHIDLHKMKNIKWENPNKKKYWAWVIDDATRISYVEVLPNKKAKTLSHFIKRAYKWFKLKWITIKKLLSDNWLEFTTHHINSRSKHSFEITLKKLNIVHKYTRVRRPQTNWKIERFWRIINEDFFFKHSFESHKDFWIRFKDWLCYYNTKRKHWWIKFITPMKKLENLFEKNLVCVE